MTNHKNSFSDRARVTWAIAAKDIVGALRNKNALSVLISALFVVLLYRALPLMAAMRDPVRVLIYDAGDSALVAYLENSDAVTVISGYDTQADMLRSLAKGDVPELGLVIPESFDQSLETGVAPPLRGYASYWLSEAQITRVRQLVEAEIATLIGRPVPIELQAERAYVEPGRNGPGTQAAMALVFVLAMIGASFVPHLMLEEKQARTLEVLLVSPASESQVIVAKALAGLFYCALAAAVTLGLNAAFVVHWGVTLLAVMSFSLLAVLVGLWVGLRVETRAQLSVLVWPIFIVAFVPLVLYLLGDLFPDILTRLIVVIPSATILVLMSHAFAGSVDWGAVLVGTGWVFVCAGLALAATVALLRRRDRMAEGRSPARATGTPLGTAGAESASAAAGLPGGASVANRLPQTGRTGAVARRPTRATFRASRPASGLSIFAALVAKDMRESINNKLLLSILLGTAFVVINGGALPLLIQARVRPTAIVYDEGRSTIVRGLGSGDQFAVALAESRQEMEAAVIEGLGTRLGLVLPADFDARAGSGQVIQLDGYSAHWADPEKVRQLTALFEEQLGLATWGTVTINSRGHQLYPTAGAGGLIGTNLLTMVIAVAVIGIMLAPLLLVEEKESHTLEAVLVSPAKPIQIVSAKAAVAAAFSLLTLALVALFNAQWIVHWDIFLLAAVLTVGFVVALGLLVGVLADSPTSAAFWAGPLLLVLITSVMAELWFRSATPSIVRDVVVWLPGSLMMNLFRLSAAGEVPAAKLWPYAGALMAMAAVAYLLVGWRLRRWGR